MATIDIRAEVTCSLGELISGSVSDGYIQGNGLILTRGSCELVGLHNPAVGTKVTFRYKRGSTTKPVPRTLRVMSSFADPFRNTTQVELGCLLTLLQGKKPLDLLSEGAPNTLTPAYVTCAVSTGRYGRATVPAYPQNVPNPVSAQVAALECLSRLGITANGLALTSQFVRNPISLTPGYVNVLSDLLLSESCYGFLDVNEVLQVKKLDLLGGSGPSLNAERVIDLAPINVGDLPGKQVSITFSALKANSDIAPIPSTGTAEYDEYEEAVRKRDWEYEESEGSPTEFSVRYQYTGYTTNQSSTTEEWGTYIPYSYTETTYGKAYIPSSASGCAVPSPDRPDMSDKVMTRVTYVRTVLGVDAANYCSDLLTAGLLMNVSYAHYSVTREFYEYDDAGELSYKVVETYDPVFKWLGATPLTFLYRDANGAYTAVFDNDLSLLDLYVLVERVVQSFDYIKERGEQYPAAYKETVIRYQNYAITQQGQQAFAKQEEVAPLKYKVEAEDWAIRYWATLVQVESTTTTRSERTITTQTRPPESVRQTTSSTSTSNSSLPSSEVATQTVQATFLGPGISDYGYQEFSIPYVSDGYWSPGGIVQPDQAPAQVLLFAEVQNRLLAGNRFGANIQTRAGELPTEPFAPFYLKSGGTSALYRVNAMNWAFSNEGVVTSVDALFWGGAGGSSGAAWFPVGPSVGGFPPDPPTNNTKPDKVLGSITIATDRPADELNAAFPAAVANEAVVDEATGNHWVSDGVGGWINVGTTPGDTANVTNPIPIWDIQVALVGITYSKASIAASDYQVGSLGTVDLGVAVTRTTMQYSVVLSAEGALFQLTGQASAPARVRGIAGEAGVFTVTGHDAGDLGFYVLPAEPAVFTVSLKAAGLAFTRSAWKVDGGMFNVTGHDAGSFQGKGMALEGATFTVTGQAAGGAITRGIAGEAGTFTTAGAAATMRYTAPQFAISTYTSNNADRVVNDVGFQPGLVLIKSTSATPTAHGTVFDSIRGATNYWHTSSGTTFATSATTLTSFNSDGFNVGVNALVNSGTTAYAAFSWRKTSAPTANTSGSITSQSSANIDAGYSMFTWTGNGADATVGHGLGVTPGLIIIKRDFAVGAWVGSSLIGSGLQLLMTSTAIRATGFYNAADASTVSLKAVGNQASNHVGYAFASVDGVSKVGTYNGSASGVSVNVGFQPSLVLIKSYLGATGNWLWHYSPTGALGAPQVLQLNASSGAATSTGLVFTATGFDAIGGSTVSGSTSAYIYLAFA